MKISIFWFRRDLRLEDNTALYMALNSRKNVLPIFIFDSDIIHELPVNDARIQFIYQNLKRINEKLLIHQASILCLKGKPIDIWNQLISTYTIDSVFINRDYEPYAIQRDKDIHQLLRVHNIELLAFKDQVIHEQSDVLKGDGTPYTVFTPYKNKWLEVFVKTPIKPTITFENFHKENSPFPSMEALGFQASEIKVRDFDIENLSNYDQARNFPNLDSTSYLGPHLRFGTISIRQIIERLKHTDRIFLSELIWREFFMQILYHFPKVVSNNFRSKYDGIQWLNKPEDFEKWCNGMTGYPLVDAGMRQLNQTGYMHNRVRMVTASFLCKHLLIDWRMGEAYFASKLLDYELASNNGNWQWSAGTGCDAAPYFRIFNPIEQLRKFDKNGSYVRKWVPEIDTEKYPEPMVEHKEARIRALETYKVGIESN